ncbi:hypothetical protein BKP43_41060 [Variovorax boronicumulans]|uniref:hypothetical protein n=1 Tax=Variovorax boronicumulans TaxID=436515 RepID=UPI00209BE50A|nr:hypothetical protein [Variovorax boronicumulans]PBI86920.1 hypothetical protein BKP43_41060 [Variovorax boronicumulans]
MTGDSHALVMPSAPSATEVADGVGERLLTFSYLGWWFSCAAQRVDDQTFRPVVFCRAHGGGNVEGAEQRLPPDTDNVAYGSEAEALRHAEQQAIRWAHDRTGDGQGRF